MTDWYCYKDKVKMVPTDLALKYMQLVQYVPGIMCPECYTAYLTEDVVTTVVQAAEDALDQK
jgi:hypothetical protein